MNSFLSGIAHQISAAVTWVITQLGAALQSNTTVTIGNRYAALLRLDAILCAYIGVFVLLYAAARAALTGNLSNLAHDVLRVMLAVISSFLLILIIPYIEQIVSAASSFIASSFISSSTKLTAALSTIVGGGLTAVLASGGTALLAVIFLGLLALVAVMSLWIILIIAQGVVYLAAFFFPLTWVISPKWGRRVAELGSAFLFTPFLITSVLAVGMAVLGDGVNPAVVIEHMILGVGILFVGCFSPFAAHKMIHSGASYIASIKAPTDHAMQHAGGLTSAATIPTKDLQGASLSKTMAVSASRAGGFATAIPAAVIAGIRHHQAQAADAAQESPSTAASPSPQQGRVSTPQDKSTNNYSTNGSNPTSKTSSTDQPTASPPPPSKNPNSLSSSASGGN